MKSFLSHTHPACLVTFVDALLSTSLMAVTRSREYISLAPWKYVSVDLCRQTQHRPAVHRQSNVYECARLLLYIYVLLRYVCVTCVYIFTPYMYSFSSCASKYLLLHMYSFYTFASTYLLLLYYILLAFGCSLSRAPFSTHALTRHGKQTTLKRWRLTLVISCAMDLYI